MECSPPKRAESDRPLEVTSEPQVVKGAANRNSSRWHHHKETVSSVTAPEGTQMREWQVACVPTLHRWETNTNLRPAWATAQQTLNYNCTVSLKTTWKTSLLETENIPTDGSMMGLEKAKQLQWETQHGRDTDSRVMRQVFKPPP